MCEEQSSHLLNENEKEVIQWLIDGYKIQEIAEKKMFRSQESVNLYIRSAKSKLGASNLAQLAVKALNVGAIK